MFKQQEGQQVGTSSITELLSGFDFNLFSVELITRPCKNLLRLILRLKSD